MAMDTEQNGRQDTVELVYRPTRADILAGIRLRERRRHLHLLRWGLTGLFGAAAVQAVAARDGSAVSFVTAAFCAALIWSIPRLQAHHVFRLVSWQGEYRTSVSETSIRTGTAHATLEQRWSVFRGYREIRDHVVLLSRDPNILLVEVLPKRGLSPEDAERLRALLSRHLPRV
ncbi:YcxB family protein [Streptomyces albus]|uniref:YcxB family protein n=1 Tax=Streptomyces albus TaxID=1888 RepID=UPI0004C60D81|nr:YcxB family protein [Streptomyces albus]